MSKFLSFAAPILHSGTIATNIFTKIKLTESFVASPYTEHSYVIVDGDRPDTIANAYYGSPEYAWLIYMANNIIDPYYDWPMDSSAFYEYIITKYGSMEKAQEKILYYTVTWEEDESSLTVGGYNALPAENKKYWTQVFDVFGNVSSYARKPLDMSVETNKIIEVTYSSTDDFSATDRVVQRSGGAIVASGFIKNVTDTVLTIDKVSGSFQTGINVEDAYDNTITGSVSAVTTIYTAISADEFVYWKAISAYEYEEFLNEAKRTINIIDKQYIEQIEQQIRRI